MLTVVHYKPLDTLLSKSTFKSISPTISDATKIAVVVYMTVLQMKPVWELVWAKQGPLKTLTMASEEGIPLAQWLMNALQMSHFLNDVPAF
jgi:hypothetical protein